MTSDEVPTPPAEGTPPQVVPEAPATMRPPRRMSVLGTLMRIVLIVGGVLLIAGMALFAFVMVSLGDLGKGPTATFAPVAWGTTSVQLTSERPSVGGRTSMSAPYVPASAVRVGVNAGVPSLNATEPGQALSGPVVRIRAHAAGDPAEPVSCVAPCELNLPETFDCSGGECRMAIDVTVELLPAGGQPAGPVTLAISAGITGHGGQPLATGFTFDFAFDAPQSSGGS